MADLCGKGDKYIEVLGLGHQFVLPSLQAPFTDEEYMKKALSLHPDFLFAGKEVPEVFVMGEDEKDEEEDPHIIIHLACNFKSCFHECIFNHECMFNDVPSYSYSITTGRARRRVGSVQRELKQQRDVEREHKRQRRRGLMRGRLRSTR